jgi:type II secretory pathway pseudopilin PulG
MFTRSNIYFRRARLRAFTLLEVSLALIILMLLVGVLYAIVDGTFRSAGALKERQERTRELNAFLSLCRRTFANLPATATFQARLVPDSNGNHVTTELVFRNAPGMWWWGGPGNESTSTILGVRGQVGGFVGLGVLQDSEEAINSYLKDGTTKRPWFVLLPDLRDAQWRFYEPVSASWTNDWTNLSVRPTCAELTLATADGSRSYVFRIPAVVNPAASAQQ